MHHYGAPLEQGVLVADTIRCPWHHACFQLTTGAASRAPALNDLASYDVAVENNIVRVTRKRDHARPKAEGYRARGSSAPERVLFDANPSAGPKSVVIIGGGAAGNACAEMLRREGYRGPITVIEPDPDAPYDRPNLSKDYLAGNAPEEWIPLHPKEFYAAQRIESFGVEATGIDTQSKTVHLSDGTSREYGSLLIATGATPIRLDVPGGDRISYLRTLSDCRTIIERLSAAKTAVVIGASFIGLEVAASLVARGLKVSVAAPESLPLERVLGAELGKLVMNVHEQKGVSFHLNRKVTGVDEKSVILDDGSRLDADIVVESGAAKSATAGPRPSIRAWRSTVLETFAAPYVARGRSYSDRRLRV
jgi:thioredoxin reductase